MGEHEWPRTGPFDPSPPFELDSHDYKLCTIHTYPSFSYQRDGTKKGLTMTFL